MTGLPNYLIDSINQAVETQIDCCQVYFISSFSVCNSTGTNIDSGFDPRMIRVRITFKIEKKTLNINFLFF